MRKLSILSIAAIAAVFWACSTGNPAGGGGGGGATLEIRVYTYALSGDTLRLTTNEVSSYCFGNTLQLDTNQGTASNLYAFDNAGAVLNIIVSVTPMPSGAVVQRLIILDQVSGSPGQIQGSWTNRGAGYKIVSGALSAQEQAHLDSLIAAANRDNAYSTTRITIDAATITVVTDIATADIFLAGDSAWLEYGTGLYLTYPDSSMYRVALAGVSKYQVRMTGLTSGEVVNLVLSPNGDAIYTSSDTVHQEYRYYDQPSTCPNDDQPTWYTAFLTANMAKTVGANASPRAEMAARALRPFGFRFP